MIVDVIKVMNMFFLFLVNVLIFGVVENMFWFMLVELFDNKYFFFGEGGGKWLVKESNFVFFG